MTKRGRQTFRFRNKDTARREKVEEAKNKGKSAGIEGLKPALVNPIFLHINKIAIDIRQKKEKNILWGKAPYGGLLV
jgi:hypothetical protein